MATIIDAEPWPETLEREAATRWTPNYGNTRGPPALDGTSQYSNFIGGGLWQAAFLGVQIRRRAHVLAWKAMEGRLRGGMTPVDVPCCSYRPRPLTGGTVLIRSVDGWAARAVAGRVDLENSTEIEAGMYFSDYDSVTYGWRLYLIESVALAGSPGTATQRDITFWPPARKAVPLTTGKLLEFDNPRCVMRLASSDSMDVELAQRKRGDPSAQFIEAY